MIKVGGIMRILIILASLLMSSSILAQDGVGSWTVDRSTDELRGTETVSAMIIKPKTLRSTGAVVRCRDGNFNVIVILGDYLNSDELVPVRYRIDQNEIRTERWSVDTEGTAIFARKPKQLADQLMQGRKFVIEAEDYRGTPHQESFQLTGSAKAISQVYKACGIE